MNLTILTPGKKVYEGAIISVNTPGSAGNIEILKGHAPIVASLGTGTIQVVTENKKRLEFKTSGGFMEVISDEVSILLEAEG